MLTLQQLKTEAESLGFCLSGAIPVTTELGFNRFQQWIDAGYHAGMGYLSHPDTLVKRERPELLLPDVQSIIVLAATYPLLPPSVEKNTGTVGSYACGEDYHHTFALAGERLMHEFAPLLGCDVKYKIVTDSAPVLERSCAVAAGLGWIGKNGMLINRDYGSNLLLCEIFINLVVEYSTISIVRDYCGTCCRCLHACPTGCILPNRTIDAGRCLSYQTIEYKGGFETPVNLHRNVFGCDVCQLVCPWNSRNNNCDNPASCFVTQPDIHLVDIQQELQLSKTAFDKKFENTPVRRCKYSGYLRNLEALYQQKDW